MRDGVANPPTTDDVRRIVRAAVDPGTASGRRDAEHIITSMVSDLVESREFLANILESSTEYSIIAKDLGRRILSWNAGARRNYGYAPSEVLGRVGDFLHARSDIEDGIVERLHAQALRDGKAEGRFLRRRKDGTTFPARVVITRRDGRDGKPIGYLVISKDVTDEEALAGELGLARQREVAHLEHLNLLKTEFINTAAHELATPLTPLRLQVALLQRLEDTDPRIRRSVAILARTERRLSSLVQDLLSAARIQSGRLDLSLLPVDLSGIVATAVEDVRALATERDIHIQLDTGVGTVVRGDPRRLEQVVHNLLSNAIKFSPPGGTVWLRTNQDVDVVLEVRDEGIGVDPKDIERLFQPFAQVHGEGARHPGTGLGLYIVRSIVHMHGGVVTLRSPGLGEGTTVEVRLPPADAARDRGRGHRAGRRRPRSS